MIFFVYFELNDSSFNQLTHDGNVACAIQIQWLRFGVHGSVISAIAHMQKGHIVCFLFRKWFSILLNAYACFVLVFSIQGLGFNKSYHQPRGSYDILMSLCIFLRTMSFSTCKRSDSFDLHLNQRIKLATILICTKKIPNLTYYFL